MRLNNITFDIDKLFFTADTHFFHKNIIAYCDRPYTNSYKMNEDLIKKWNEKIPENATVFHMGDVAMTAIPKVLNDLLHRLNGTKYLVIGNHEKNVLQREYLREHWKGIHDVIEITIKDEEIEREQRIFMCHYPMIVWNESHRGSWQLFGHVHGGLSNKGIIKHNPAQMDVGVDTNNYTPYSYQEIKEKITKQMLKKS